jgi:streptogramin lyase
MVANGRTYAIDELDKPTYNGNLSGLTTGRDGNIWYVYFDSAVGRSSIDGFMKEYQLPGGVAITSGPDGNLWYLTNGTIYRVTPKGKLRQFAGSGAMYPTGITVGPDGDVWYGGGTGNLVGKITTTGTITQYPTGVNTGPADITAGPDGMMWFTEDSANNIGRMATSGGTISTYAIPTANSRPQGICTGPDGNVWFTEYGSGLIGKITMAGKITEYRIPTPGSEPINIVTGPDGNLWFTEFGADKIGIVTPTGVITELTTPTHPSYPNAIAVGPDGNVWFTESASLGKLGRVDFHEIKKADPIISLVALSFAPLPPQLGSPATMPLGYSVYDLNAQIISGQYPTTVHLSDSDKTGHTLLSATRLTNSMQNVTVAFDGKYVRATINAAADGGATIYPAGIAPSTAQEKPLGAGAYNGTIGADGNLWLCLTNNKIGRYTPAGVLTEFPITGGFSYNGCTLAVGSDNNVWFTETQTEQIGIITPAGSVQEFNLPYDAGLSDIAEGSDGAVWLTEPGLNQIVRMDVHGNQTVFATPSISWQIFEESDGNLYFEEYGNPNDTIARITPAGVITPIQSVAGVNNIAKGADGNIWLELSGQLIKMRLDGKILATYNTPGNVIMFNLEPGPEHSLWFTNPFDNYVGRVDSTGHVRWVNTYTPNSAPPSIFLGFNGMMSFPEPNAYKLGTLDPATI